jgi:hypothetical protein
MIKNGTTIAYSNEQIQRNVCARRFIMGHSTSETSESKEQLDRVCMNQWLLCSESNEIGLMDLVLLEGLNEHHLPELKN